jgi:DNA-binding transcriptional LysR family regulator
MAELERIRTFVKVVEAGSFAAAAARSTAATSSVARQIKSLEDELGVRLLNRSTRHLSLTEAGRHFYDRAATILNELNDAKHDAMSFQDSVKGTLRVSIRTSAGTTVIVPALPTLLERYPDLSLDLSLTDQRVELIANNIDVAVWMGPIPDGEIIARRLSPACRILSASPKYLERHGTPQTPQDLLKHNCIFYTGPDYGNRWTFTREGRTEQLLIRGNLRTDNGLVLLAAAQADQGIIVAQKWAVRRPLKEGRLVRILNDYVINLRREDAELYVVYPSSRGLSRSVRVFVDFLVELFECEGEAPPKPR